MFERNGSTLKEGAARAGIAAELAQDRKFRKQVREAVKHAAAAGGRARPKAGAVAVAARLATDENLRRELGEVVDHLRQARERLQRKRGHRTRNVLLAGAGVATLAAVPQTRRRIASALDRLRGGSAEARVIDETIEVDVPVSVAYNQWTQFEEFPQFMSGVEEVRQLDDTRLHWVATVAGKRAEWDARILEQHPDRQVTWVSEDGRTTRGTVSFEELGPERTRVALSMSYQAEGVAEVAGSAAGLDARRVRGDLERFKELIERRGAETGAWRGDVSGGEAA